MTPFCFEHVFRAPSTAAVLEAYFDAAHQVEQDRQVEIIERAIIEFVDDGAQLRRTSRVVPRRHLPALVRPLMTGEFHYLETVTWQRDADELAIEIRPSLLRGRVKIDASYRLEPLDRDRIRRRYEGSVSVDVAVVATRIERGIVSELERSLPVAAACTQQWLDRQPWAVSDSSGLNPGNPSGIIMA
jgi:hypothetical protein